MKIIRILLLASALTMPLAYATITVTAEAAGKGDKSKKATKAAYLRHLQVLERRQVPGRAVEEIVEKQAPHALPRSRGFAPAAFGEWAHPPGQ